MYQFTFWFGYFLFSFEVISSCVMSLFVLPAFFHFPALFTPHLCSISPRLSLCQFVCFPTSVLCLSSVPHLLFMSHLHFLPVSSCFPGLYFVFAFVLGFKEFCDLPFLSSIFGLKLAFRSGTCLLVCPLLPASF